MDDKPTLAHDDDEGSALSQTPKRAASPSGSRQGPPTPKPSNGVTPSAALPSR